MPTVLAQAELAAGMLRTGPPAGYRQRLLSLLAQAHVVAGFLHFDLHSVDAARWHYDRARSAAYESGDAAVGAFVTGHLSWLAWATGRGADAVEFAAAAQAWAGRSDSPRARVFATAHVVDANRVDGGRRYAERALDAGHRDVSELAGREDDPAGALFYWVGPQQLVYPTVRSALALNRPDAVLAATAVVSEALDQSRIRDVSNVALYEADAWLLKGELDTATARLAHAVDLIGQHRSPRTVEHFRSTRAQAGHLGWSQALAELDDRAAALDLPLTPETYI